MQDLGWLRTLHDSLPNPTNCPLTTYEPWSMVHVLSRRCRVQLSSLIGPRFSGESLLQYPTSHQPNPALEFHTHVYILDLESPTFRRVIQRVSLQQRNDAVPGWQHRALAGSNDGILACGRKGTWGHSPAWKWRWPRGSEASPGDYMVAESPGWGEEWVLLWMLYWCQVQSGTVGAEIQGNWKKKIPRN